MDDVKRFIISTGLVLYVLASFAQPMSEPELQAYTNKVFYEIWPRCEQAGDQACIFLHADSLANASEALSDWNAVIYFLDWKAHYCDKYNRKDIYYQTLKKVESFLIQRKDTLGVLFHEYWATTQLRWGKYYYDRGDWPRSLEKYEQINTYLLNRPEKTDEDLSFIANAYTSMGVIHRDQGAYDIAQAYFFKSIDFEKQRGQDVTKSGFVAIASKHLGDLYFKKRDFDRSLRYYTNARQIYERTDTTQSFNRNGLATTLLGIAILHKTANRHKEALKALGDAQKVDGNSRGVDYNLWFHFGEVFAAKGNIVQAYAYFNRAFERRREAFGLKHYKVAEVNAVFGDMAARQGDLPCALEHYQEALISLVDDFSNEDIRQNPVQFQRTFLKKDLIGIFARKIQALRQLATQTGQETHLHSAWATVQAAVNAIDVLKANNLQSEEDKLFFFQESAQVFEHGMNIALQLGPEYYSAAFELSEKSKAIILLEAFRNANALRLAGIPDSLLEREAQIKYEISAAEDALFKGDGNQELRDRLFQLKNKYRELLRTFEQSYSAYYRLRYDNRVITADAATSRLARGQALVAYFTGQQTHFAFVLRPGANIAMYQIGQESALEPLVRDMRAGIYDYFLSEQRTSALYEASAKKYAANALRLYDILLAPFAKTLPEELLIIPDGVLGYLPFDALLTTAQTVPATRFKALPYLMQKHRVSYCYSSTLWREMQENTSENKRLAAFAPAFPNNRVANPMALRGALDTLYFNQSEVEEIAGVLNQTGYYTGARATKAQFMQLAPEAGIIHIASHGIANDTASGYSFVALTAESNNPDSNRLYARELYNLQLQAAMVVLSACETGIGELKKGEGVISLARAFAYAGAKSVISTLWSVNDASTTAIMRALYKRLRAGDSKAQALQTAKIAYLESREDDLAAHPFYWSAYIAVGDMKPLYWGWWWLVGIGGVALLLVSGFLFWRRR